MSDTKTAALTDAERAANREQVKKIADVAKEIETILITHNLTWRDWMDVCTLIGERTHQTIENMSINEIKQTYERLN